MSTAHLPSVRTSPAPLETSDQVVITRYDGASVLASLPSWCSVYDEVYRGYGLLDHIDPPLAGRLARHAQRDGFTLIGAHAGAEPIGFVYGYTLPAGTLWWDGLEPEPEAGFVQEWPGRTLGVCEGLILAPWRGLGLTSRMYLELLSGRTEERLAVHIAHGNDLMLAIAGQYGALHVGDLEPFPGWQRHAAFILPLRPQTAAGSA